MLFSSLKGVRKCSSVLCYITTIVANQRWSKNQVKGATRATKRLETLATLVTDELTNFGEVLNILGGPKSDQLFD